MIWMLPWRPASVFTACAAHAGRRAAALRSHGVVLALLLGVALAACGPAAAPPPAQRMSQPLTASTIHAQGLTYVALGASDAFGVGTDDPDRENWPTVLAGQLSGPIHEINLSLPGATVSQAIATQLPPALDVHPQLVTIWLALNDFTSQVDLARYEQQFTALLQALRNGTTAQVFVANLPDLTLLPYFRGRDLVALTQQVQLWNKVIAAACAAQGAHLVDLGADHDEFASHPEYVSDDGLHPSTLGAARLASLFATAIHQAGIL